MFTSLHHLFDQCVYHEGCVDGMACAAVVKLECPDVELIELPAGQDLEMDPSSFSGRNVIFVDVAPSLDYLRKVVEVAERTVVIDHHITYQTAIETIMKELEDKDENKDEKLEYHFALDKAACQLTFQYFYPHKEIPWFLNYIADRDLWKTTMPNTREITTALYAEYHTRSIDNIIRLFHMKGRELERFQEHLLKKGKILVEIRNEAIKAGCRNKIHCTYNTYNIWLYECDRHLLSDVGSRLTRWRFNDGNYPDFVVYWSYDVEEHQFRLSFRSDNSSASSVDVEKIARELDPRGGGHRNASGCILDGSVILREIFVPVDEDDE